jgi:hypothetical protein
MSEALTDPILATDPATEHDSRRSANITLLVLAAAGAAVSVSLGVYGREHTPSGGVIFDLGFPTMRAMKSWLATVSMALVFVQVFSAMAMYGRVPRLKTTPKWVPFAHRWSGTTAFVVSLPVAYHCLWSLGFHTANARPLLHGLFGLTFYGAITTKLLALRSDRLPRWAIPVLGSTVALTLTGVWLTSALWFFTNVSFPALP